MHVIRARCTGELLPRDHLNARLINPTCSLRGPSLTAPGASTVAAIAAGLRSTPPLQEQHCQWPAQLRRPQRLAAASRRHRRLLRRRLTQPAVAATAVQAAPGVDQQAGKKSGGGPLAAWHRWCVSLAFVQGCLHLRSLLWRGERGSPLKRRQHNAGHHRHHVKPQHQGSSCARLGWSVMDSYYALRASQWREHHELQRDRACGRWQLGSDSKEDGARREPMGRTALRLAKLVSADRGLIVLATLFGVRTALSTQGCLPAKSRVPQVDIAPGQCACR